MSFIESPRFPDDISQGSSGGPAYSTDIVVVNSGFEVRNINWTEARHSFNAGFGIRTEAQLSVLLEYFHAMRGMANTFRYKDWGDYKSVGVDETVTALDQTIGTGNAVAVDFQLVKAYTQGLTTQRDIKKPVDGTVLISVNGVTQIETTDYTIVYSTGVVTFNVAPPSSQSVKAGYEFDVPVRFDTDRLSRSFDNYMSGSVDIPLVEVRL